MDVNYSSGHKTKHVWSYGSISLPYVHCLEAYDHNPRRHSILWTTCDHNPRRHKYTVDDMRHESGEGISATGMSYDHSMICRILTMVHIGLFSTFNVRSRRCTYVQQASLKHMSTTLNGRLLNGYVQARNERMSMQL